MTNYIMSNHALQRADERLKIADASRATKYVNYIIRGAFLVGEVPHKDSGGMVKIFDNAKERTRVFVGQNNVVVTLYKFADALMLPGAFKNDVRAVIKRKYKALKAEYVKQSRSLTIELAEWNFEVARLELNKARAKSPKAQRQIQGKIDECMTKVNVINGELDVIERNFKDSTRGIDLILA